MAFRFNGKDYMIRFVGCSVYPQGYPAIVNQLGAFNGFNLLADIRTGGCKTRRVCKSASRTAPVELEFERRANP